MKRNFNRYRIHRVTGLLILPFLLLSALTGFFRANYKWFWKEDYKKVKNFSFDTHLRPPVITIDSLFKIIDLPVNEIRLRKEAGHVFYEVSLEKGPAVLMDAQSGKIVSPVSRALATDLVKLYVKEGTPLSKLVLNKDYLTRKDKKKKEVYIASFNDALNTQIIIDYHTGEIVEEIDDNLKFGFLMVKLHDYDFWNLKRGILSFVGCGVTLIGVSGLYVWLRKKKKRKKTFIKVAYSSNY